MACIAYLVEPTQKKKEGDDQNNVLGTMTRCITCQAECKGKRQCRPCYRKQNPLNEDTFDMESSQDPNMSQVDIPLDLVNAAFANASGIGEPEIETAPTTLAEMFDMFLQMRLYFTKAVKERDVKIDALSKKVVALEELTNSATARVSTLEEKSDGVEGSLLTKTTEIADLRSKISSQDSIQSIQSNQKEIREVIDNHQRYLEKSDSFRRENNVVLFGLQESENDGEKVKEILSSIECTAIEPERMKRLGKVPEQPSADAAPADGTTPRSRNRPLLLSFKSRSEKSKILANSSKLKDSNTYGTIYIKKDQTPMERKEWARLRTVLQREKERPDNMGVNVKMDYRRRCVMVGDRVIEKGNFRYGPEI